MLILDTDIGSDVDDALALATLVGSPEVALTAVTTVYGDTVLRARLAARLLRESACPGSVRVLAGAGATRSGANAWWAGHEGAQFADLESEPFDPTDAVEFMTTVVDAAPGAVEILAIGPLTNVALCLDADPEFDRKVRRLVVMGGDFREPGRRVPEHNIKSDVAAAERVFASRARIVIGGLDLTTRIEFRRADIECIRSSGRLGALLGVEIDTWWRYLDDDRNTPHDAVLALWLTRPELFHAEPLRVTLKKNGLIESNPPDGSGCEVWHLTDVHVERARNELIRRICAASGGGAASASDGGVE